MLVSVCITPIYMASMEESGEEEESSERPVVKYLLKGPSIGFTLFLLTLA